MLLPWKQEPHRCQQSEHGQWEHHLMQRESVKSYFLISQIESWDGFADKNCRVPLISTNKSNQPASTAEIHIRQIFAYLHEQFEPQVRISSHAQCICILGCTWSCDHTLHRLYLKVYSRNWRDGRKITFSRVSHWQSSSLGEAPWNMPGLYIIVSRLNTSLTINDNPSLYSSRMYGTRRMTVDEA